MEFHFSSLNTRVATRLQELEQMPAQMSVELRTQALIEYKSLKLLQYQKQLRQEILQTMKVRKRKIRFEKVKKRCSSMFRKIH